MQEPSKPTEVNALPTLPPGSVNIDAIREGLAMLMDALRVMEGAGVRLSRAMILSNGMYLLLPMCNIPDHVLGVMEKTDSSMTELVFTIDGISVMEKSK